MSKLAHIGLVKGRGSQESGEYAVLTGINTQLCMWSYCKIYVLLWILAGPYLIALSAKQLLSSRIGWRP